MRVRYTRTALSQLDRVIDYIDARNPQGARHVRDRIRAVVALLALHPDTGQMTNRPGQRRMVTNPYPYIIFYRVDRDDLIVQRIRHTARRPL